MLSLSYLSDATLAPRIRELRGEIAGLERQRAQLLSQADQTRLVEVDEQAIARYVRNLRRTLLLGTPQERKEILAGFIESVRVDNEKVEIKYRLPYPKEETEELALSVLPAVRSSGA